MGPWCGPARRRSRGAASFGFLRRQSAGSEEKSTREGRKRKRCASPASAPVCASTNSIQFSPTNLRVRFHSKLPLCAYCKSVCGIYSTQPRACSDELQADEVLQSRSSRFQACARSSVGPLLVAASRARATPIKTNYCELILRISHHARCAPGGGGETHNSETVETR